MILSCQGISKSFGEKVILEDASFHIEEKEKVKEILKESMEKAVKLEVPLEVEVSEATDWYDVK